MLNILLLSSRFEVFEVWKSDVEVEWNYFDEKLNWLQDDRGFLDDCLLFQLSFFKKLKLKV